MSEPGVRRVVLVSGCTGTGKSTIAAAIAGELGCTVASFDWLMSALRAHPDVWAAVESPVERQRAVGWSLMARVAEAALRGGGSVVIDCVAREDVRAEAAALASRHDARFDVVECVCSDESVHRSRVEGRTRDIPGWYELEWSDVQRSRDRYQPLDPPKLVLDAVDPIATNVGAALARLRGG
jgi:predicted kinase